jgi:hypothetical protein
LDVHEELSKSTITPVPIPVWTACVANGSLLELRYTERREITGIYKEIELYNIRQTATEQKKAKEAIEKAIEME